MESIYVIDLSNNKIKTGRSTALAVRLRTHATTMHAFGVYPRQIWSMQVFDSAAAEQRLLDALSGRPGAKRAGGRETFEGVSFLEACALGASIADAQPQPAAAIFPRRRLKQASTVLREVVAIFEEQPDRDHIGSVELIAELARRVPEWSRMSTKQLSVDLKPYGLKPRQESVTKIRGYNRSDVEYVAERVEHAQEEPA